MKRKKSNLRLKVILFLAGISGLGITLNAQTWSTITTAKASDASANSYFGSAVVIDGDYAVIRAVGAIYVFKRNRNTYAWIQQQKLTLTGSYNYGNGSVAISGNYIAAIGGNNASGGSLYIFKRDTTSDTWSQQQTLTPSDAPGFSGAVSISGNYVVAGATSETEDANGSNTLANAGAAYVYELSSGTWSEQQKIVATSREASALFGSSVSISKNYLLVRGLSSGANVAIFKLDNATDLWSFQQTLTCSNCSNVVISNGSIFVNEYSYSYNNYTYVVKTYMYYNSYTWDYDYDFYYTYTYKYICNNNNKLYKKNSAGIWTLQQTITQNSPTTTTSTSSQSRVSDWDDLTPPDPVPSPIVPTTGGRILNISISGDYLLTGTENSQYSLYKKNSADSYSLLQSFSPSSSSSTISSFISGEDVAIGDNSSNSYAGTVYFYKMSPYATLSTNTASIGSIEGSTASVNLIYNTPFTATSNQSWLTVSPISVSPVVCSDTTALVFTASANTSTAPRSAKVTIAATGVSNQYVIITQKLSSTITWSKPEDISYGTALSSTQLNATSNIAGTFTYSPASGTILNAGKQTLSVTFKPTDSTNYAPGTQAVQININKVTPTLTWNTPSNISYGTALSTDQLNAKSNIGGAFVYTPASGTILNAGNGQKLTANFVPIDTLNYAKVSKTVIINVTKAAPVITWATPSDITVGAVLCSSQLNATANTNGAFVYKPAIGTELNAGKSQALNVKFTPLDTANYTTASKTVYINVNKKVPVLSWATPSDIVYGTALSNAQLDATSNLSGSFIYTPVTGSIINTGLQTLKAMFTPSDANYDTASITVQINVKKATPIITWANPLIADGTSLSSTQLNATANIPGTFNYSPSFGTVLYAKSGQTLTVNFVPSDTTNYQPANKTVQVTVIQDTLSVSPTMVNIGTETNSKSNTIVSSNYTWTVSSDQTWLTVSPTSGSGNDTILFTADAYTDTPRSAIVTIFSGNNVQTVIVTQSQKTGITVAKEENEHISLYPNPVKDGFWLSGTNEPTTLMLFNMNGQLLLTKKFTGISYISVPTLVHGTYIVKIEMNSIIIDEKKFIKE